MNCVIMIVYIKIVNIHKPDTCLVEMLYINILTYAVCAVLPVDI